MGRAGSFFDNPFGLAVKHENSKNVLDKGAFGKTDFL